jgi:phage-related protein
MADAGKTYVEVIPNLDSFGSQLKAGLKPAVTSAGSEITKSSAGWRSKFKGVMGTIGKAAGIGFAGATVAAVKFGKDSIAAYQESAQVGAQTNAVIKSTGAIAGVTQGHVGKLASSIRDYSGIEDEAIQSGENMLLTFKNIRNGVGAGNDIFDQATTTLADMSAALGKDPKTAAIQLGKALQDPVKGITALSRVGVTFDDQQKKTIANLVKTGKTADAQKVILKELTSEFGGSAKAMGKANPAAILQSQIGDVEEQVGKTLLPVVSTLLAALKPLLEQLGPLLGNAFAALTPALTAILKALTPVAEILINALSPILKSLTPLLIGLAPVVAQLAVVLGELLAAVLPILPPLVQLVALLLPIVTLALKLANLLLGPILKGIQIVTTWIGKATSTLARWGAAWAGIVQRVSLSWSGIRRLVSEGLAAVGRIFTGAFGKLKAGWDRFWDGLKGAASGVWSHVTGVFKAGINSLIDILNRAISAYNRIPLAPNIPTIPRLAQGAANFPGGAAIVGDAGPELLSLPRGSRVAPFGGGLGVVGDIQITNWDSGRARLRGDMVATVENDRRFRNRRARVG